MSELQYQNDMLKAMNQKLKGNEGMYRLVCETSCDAFLYYSFEKDEVYTLGRWSEFFNFEIRSVNDLHLLYDIMSDFYVEKVRSLVYLEKRNLEKANCEALNQNKRAWYSINAIVEYDDYGKPIHKLLTISDITKFKKQNEELAYLAYYDPLTGLYNRNYFVRLLSEFVRNAKEDDKIVDVVIVDIDDFRKVNDGMGMVVGDELVQQLGGVLKEFSSANVIVGHINSDIYCMAIYEPKNDYTMENLYQRLKSRLRRPFYLSNGYEISITVSVGVASYPEASKDAVELINCAEIVMFRGKSLGKNTIQYFDTPILDDFIHNVQMDNKLKEAVTNNHFMLKYQPQFYADSKELRGVEALIRWNDVSEDSVISPTVFIPMAEKNGTIVPIGKWVIEESIRQCSEWHRKYEKPIIMSINVSAIQYMKEDFVDHLISVIEKHDVDPRYIELEVTESVLIDGFENVAHKLTALKEYGIRISLDDFGTGFSSLSYLKKLPIDTLKIDKSFIDTVLIDSPTRVITESIIKMVKTLGFEAVAEGVEEFKQYEYLQSIGCDVIQGFYFAKPQNVEEIEKLLQ
ncbi:MAG: GGDEF domain-containing protein [Lachnospiraceae bacterium]|nr:GGDEF domain-containing protein [Lachnospiraceae bacterium]